jgi:phosphomannomutase/phosphoglucomutase
MIPENIFRAYDIRGIYDKDLTTDIVEKIGKAFGTFVGENKTVVVGRDGRLSGELLKNSFISGLVSTGCNVVDAGIVTTPVLYFSVPNLKADAGIMITASHNPKEWNGFKLCDSNGLIYHGNTIQKLKEIIEKNEIRKSPVSGEIKTYGKIFEDYKNFVLQKVSVNKKLKIVVDAGNGAASLIAPSLFEELGHEVIKINGELNGEFPGRGPDPTKENVLNELKEIVIKQNADLGVAYDGDGDRVVFVDNLGREISSGSTIIMIIAKDILQKRKNEKIVFDCCCSFGVEDFIRANGGIPIVEKVGHSFIIHRMQEENAIFAGEYSNHFYFPEIPGFDDAVFGSLRLSEILSKTNDKFSQMVDSVPKHFYRSDWEFECSDEKKFEIIEKLKRKMEFNEYKISDLDGVKVFFDDGWILWRASNTRPVLLAFLEAKTEERFNELQKFAEQEMISAMR